MRLGARAQVDGQHITVVWLEAHPGALEVLLRGYAQPAAALAGRASKPASGTVDGRLPPATTASAAGSNASAVLSSSRSHGRRDSSRAYQPSQLPRVCGRRSGPVQAMSRRSGTPRQQPAQRSQEDAESARVGGGLARFFTFTRRSQFQLTVSAPARVRRWRSQRHTHTALSADSRAL